MRVTQAQRKSLGRRVIKARKDRGWDQKTLADRAGLNGGYVSNIEHGVKAPSLYALHKLRDALDLDDSTWLLWLDGLRPREKDNAA